MYTENSVLSNGKFFGVGMSMSIPVDGDDGDIAATLPVLSIMVMSSLLLMRWCAFVFVVAMKAMLLISLFRFLFSCHNLLYSSISSQNSNNSPHNDRWACNDNNSCISSSRNARIHVHFIDFLRVTLV